MSAVGACAAIFLLLGYVRLLPGASLPPASYRGWAFEHAAYSDVIALYGDHYGSGARPVPYVQDRIEYPVLLGIALYLPALLPGGAPVAFSVSYLMLALALGITLWALARLPGARIYWMGASPALALLAGLNWDILALVSLTLALLAFQRERFGWSGALAALGIATKIFPGAMVLPALGIPGRRARARLAWTLAAVVLVVNVPFMVLGWDRWKYFFTFNSGRIATNSVWQIFGMRHGFPLHLVSLGPVIAASIWSLAAVRRAARDGGDVSRMVRMGTALALTTWIATNKIWSPQYALYGFLAGALVAAPFWAFVILTVVSVADYYIAFAYLAGGMSPAFQGTLFFPDAAVRTLAWLGLAAFIAQRMSPLVRSEPGGEAAGLPEL